MTHEVELPVCSARGCRQNAKWMLEWRNPRLHSVDRRKYWAACDTHEDSLRGFLTSRSFPCRTITLEEYFELNAESTN
ncbi:hypothetical protein [Haloglycomyces albus]|uniref:hypothetical protein n=1 Tax=Haloglycomyces albus TaxID=526067 RepID=UPI001B7FF07E|nr:hypothetical protein [Haloglycomyces albus]